MTAYVLDYSIPPTSHSQSHSQDYSNHHPLGPGTVLSRWAAHTMPASRRVLTERTVIDQQQRQCITSLLEHPHGVVSLASHSLHFATLGGWARWNLSKPTEGLVSATDTWWTGMAFGLGTAELIVASNGGDLLSVTTEYGRVTKTVCAICKGVALCKDAT